MPYVEMVHHKKHSRRHGHKKHSRRHSRKHSRKQHGGGSCAAMPLNYKFAQSGGMAPFAVGGSDYLLDAPTRVQAEVGPLDKAFADLSVVIPRQAGGRRTRTHKMSRKHRMGRKHKMSLRKGYKKRQQRGGAAPFAGPYTLLDHRAVSDEALAQNPQFANEGAVNKSYSEFAGAQH